MEQKLKKEPLGNGFYVYVTPHHTFGTDAVLLSNFAKPKRNDSLVDLGTGCGIIPLVMLRDGNLKRAFGVDISPEAAEIAALSAKEQSEKFTVIESNLNDLSGKIEFGCHTLVTCNPPYKAPGAGLKNPDPVAATARHEVECTLEDIVSVAARLLQTGGRLCMCQRPERLGELMRVMSEKKIEPKRLRIVCQRLGEEPWLILVEGKKCSKTGLRIDPPLFIEQNGALSDEMIEIYGSYKVGHTE